MIVWNLGLLPVIAGEMFARGQVRLTSDACLVAWVPNADGTFHSGFVHIRDAPV